MTIKEAVEKFIQAKDAMQSACDVLSEVAGIKFIGTELASFHVNDVRRLSEYAEPKLTLRGTREYPVQVTINLGNTNFISLYNLETK